MATPSPMTPTLASRWPTVPAEFEVKLFATEPLVRQPCSMPRAGLLVGMGPQYRNPKLDTPGDSVVIVSDTRRRWRG